MNLPDNNSIEFTNKVNNTDFETLILWLIKETSYQKKAVILNKMTEINNNNLNDTSKLNTELNEIDRLYKKLISQKRKNKEN